MQELTRQDEPLGTEGVVVPEPTWKTVSREAEEEHQKWIEEREPTLGSSEAAAAVGLHPNVSVWTTWARKRGLLARSQEETEAMEFGNLLEPYVSELYQRRSGRKISDLGRHAIQRNPKYPFAHSTIDRVVFDDEKGPGIAEMKSTGGFFGTEWVDEAPLVAQIQLQHQLAVGVEEGEIINWGSVAGLIGGFRFSFKYADFERDNDFIQMLMDKEFEFMELVKSGKEPPVDGSESTAESLRIAWNKDSGRTIDLPASAIEYDSRLAEAKAKIKALESTERECENNLKAMLKDATFGRLPGGVVYSYKSSPRKAYSVEATTVRTLRRKVE